MPQQPPADEPNTGRRQFLAAAGGALAAAALPPAQALSTAAPAPSWEEANETLATLQQRLSGGTSARELTQMYLDRIARADRPGRELRAYIEMNPRALEAADALDAERKAGRVRGPLHGIPIAIKDNIGTAGMSTTAGCLGLEGVQPADAPLVKRLREAGVVILGKTNLSEWANFRSSNSVSGWSSRGGQTRNPYALERSPSGSSSGSAVAAAVRLCAAAIGSETDGSITSPAACNSLVGLKPTIGLVSRDGIVPISHSQDTAGPMARTVMDCALLMNAIAGPDPGDPTTLAAGVPHGIDFTRELGRASLKGVRLGVGRQYYGVNEKADAIIDTALAALRDQGAELVDVEIPSFGKFDEAEFDVLLYEFNAGLKTYFARHMPRGPFKTLADVIEYNARNAERMMPIFGQDLMEKSWQTGSHTEKAYREALAKCRKLSRAGGIDATLHKHRIEAIVALTSPPAWYIDVVNGDSAKGGCTSMPAVAGYPHVTVPAGFAKGLPVGISFFGAAFTDAKLLGFASVFERATKARRAPGA